MSIRKSKPWIIRVGNYALILLAQVFASSTCAVEHYIYTTVLNPLSGNAPYFIILLRLTPDDFTRQGESAATPTQWVNQTICPCTLLITL
jgi:hypothetical protein